MAEPPPSAAAWARQVAASDPHDLGEVESQVLAQSGAPAAQDPDNRFSPMTAVKTAFWASCVLGPLLAATVMWDRSDSLHLSYYVSSSVAFPVAAAGCALGCVFLVAVVGTWFQGGRHRDGTTVTLASVTAASAALTALLARSRDDAIAGPIPTSIYLVPVHLALVLGLAVALIAALSPAPDPADADEWQRQRQLLNARTHVALHGIDALPPPSVQSLLEDRREALETLSARGLLDPRFDVDELSRRPLGQLVRRGDLTDPDGASVTEEPGRPSATDISESFGV